MRILHSKRAGQAGLTAGEVVVVLAILGMLCLMIVPYYSNSCTLTKQYRCRFILHCIGQGFKTYDIDHEKNPLQPSNTQVGMDLSVTRFDPAKLLAPLVKEGTYVNPGLFICPYDNERFRLLGGAENFSRSNISYFLSLDAGRTTNHPAILMGDRTVQLSGKDIEPGLFNLTAVSDAGWDARRHLGQGNLLFADGSVQSTRSKEWRAILQSQPLATNHLVMP